MPKSIIAFIGISLCLFLILTAFFNSYIVEANAQWVVVVASVVIIALIYFLLIRR